MKIALATVVNIFVAIFIVFGLGIIGFSVGGSKFLEFNQSANEYFTLDGTSAAGVFLFFFSITVGPTALGYALLCLTRYQVTHKLMYFFVMIIIDIALFITIVSVSAVFIGSDSYYYWYKGPNPQVNALEMLMAGLVVAVYTPMFLAIAFATFQAAYDLTYDVPTSYSFQPLQPKFSFRNNIWMIAGIVGTFIIFFVLTLFLPPTWSQRSPNIVSANIYFVKDSSYSLVHGILLYCKKTVHFVDSNVSTVDVSTGSITTIIESVPDPNWLQPQVYMKLYPDVVVFYVYVFVLIAGGVVGTYCIPVRRILQRKVLIHSFNSPLLKLFKLGMIDISVGEVAVVMSMIFLHIFWLWYWMKGWHYREISTSGPYESIQKAARAFGEMAILTTAFLTFPITRNNVWEAVFGISFQR